VHTVVFACVHNAGRSQIAAAFFNQLADSGLARAVSAGTEPAARVHPEVEQVMREVGIELSAAVPRKLTAELARGAALLVTLGCGEQCPAIMGLAVEDWPVADPKGQGPAKARAIRDELRARVERLLAARGWARQRAPGGERG
jgi:arsenate reductase